MPRSARTGRSDGRLDGAKELMTAISGWEAGNLNQKVVRFRLVPCGPARYAEQQFVGMDLHRRRSVIVRTTVGGEVLENVQIVNDADRAMEFLLADAVERIPWSL
jgi:hypothetical protein